MLFKKLKNTSKLIVISVFLVILFFNAMVFCSAFQFAEEDFAVINGKKIFLEIADTPQKQAKGLMYIKRLPEDYGMIFLFSRAELRSFWMKNVEIPLDIIFIRDKKIITIYKNVEVDNQEKNTLYKSAFKSDCVIEVNAGFCDKYNVKPGDAILLGRSVQYKWKKLKLLGDE